jgi:UDP-glucose 4-epimerase/UDP-glucuronate decarboxylase
VIVRPHNFYGPRSGHDHVIPELIARISARQDPFDLYSPAETRSFCYITDAVEALIQSMVIASVEAPTLHVGSSVETSIVNLAEALFAIAGWHPREIITRASPVGSVARRCPDVSKIRTLTGWESTTSLEEGLRHTTAWYTADHA